MNRIEIRPNDDGTWSLVDVNTPGWVMTTIGRIYDRDTAELIAQLLNNATVEKVNA